MGRSGGCGGACDASPLSCFLFRPRKSREKRRKRSHTNVSSTLSTRTSTPPVQTTHVCFHERKWVHTRLSEKDRTQGLTRRNRGVSDGGGITTLGLFHTFRKPCVARCQNDVLCRFGILAGRCSRRTQKAFGTAMRLCASLFRGAAAPLGCVICFRFCRNCGLYTLGSPRKIAHKGTHAEIGGVLGGGAIITLDTSCTFTNIPGPGVRTANFAAFGSWSGGALKERREPAEQRCAYARRCSKASRPRWAA